MNLYIHIVFSVTKSSPTLWDPWTIACQAPLSSTISQSLLKFMSNESVMLSNHLIFCRPLLLPSIFPSIRIFSNELVLRIRWPKYCSFSYSPFSEYSGWFSLGLIHNSKASIPHIYICTHITTIQIKYRTFPAPKKFPRAPFQSILYSKW